MSPHALNLMDDGLLHTVEHFSHKHIPAIEVVDSGILEFRTPPSPHLVLLILHFLVFFCHSCLH